jgi:hypothetical protein
MNIIKHPDGTVGTYTITSPTTWAALQTANKARKTRAKADRRQYPAIVQGATVAQYIKQYFALNSNPRLTIHAYPDHVDHLALYRPLPDRPAPWAPDIVEIEQC